jgi:flavin reductase (DIM6/NTAB) family NADH-FMN oxidoreductase RutF
MFSVDQHVEGRKKDTVINAQETGYFVRSMATYDLREAVNTSAQPVPSDVDEFVLPSGKLEILRIKPIARRGYYDHTVVGEIFEMRIPNVNEAEMAGLEGKPRWQ